jgi:hypothetical protein
VKFSRHEPMSLSLDCDAEVWCAWGARQRIPGNVERKVAPTQSYVSDTQKIAGELKSTTEAKQSSGDKGVSSQREDVLQD